MGKLWEPSERNQYSRFNRRRPPIDKDQRYRRVKKLLWQSVASVLIFILFFVVFQFNGPLMTSLQGNIRSWFTEDYDIQPVIKFFSNVGLWGDTFERAAFDASSKEPASQPLTIPVSGQITRPFGWIVDSSQTQVFHDGIIIAAPEGTVIKAALPGVVTRIANEDTLGRLVEITTDEDYVTTYAHCSEVLVKLNDTINSAQVIGRVGKTGQAAHSQVYFRIIKDNKPIDPAALFMPSANKT